MFGHEVSDELANALELAFLKDAIEFEMKQQINHQEEGPKNVDASVHKGLMFGMGFQCLRGIGTHQDWSSTFLVQVDQLPGNGECQLFGLVGSMVANKGQSLGHLDLESANKVTEEVADTWCVKGQNCQSHDRSGSTSRFRVVTTQPNTLMFGFMGIMIVMCTWMMLAHLWRENSMFPIVINRDMLELPLQSCRTCLLSIVPQHTVLN